MNQKNKIQQCIEQAYYTFDPGTKFMLSVRIPGAMAISQIVIR
jgi:hypothetical protein